MLILGQALPLTLTIITSVVAQPARANEPALRSASERGAADESSPAKTNVVDERERKTAIERGRAILLEHQESLAKSKVLAEWPYEGVYRVDGEIPIGYRVGGTAICALALLETQTAKRTKDVDAAIARALDFVLGALDEPLMSIEFKQGYDVRGWGHAYALGFLLRLRELERTPPEQKKAVDAAIPKLVDMLQKTALANGGGWNYSRPAGDDSHASTFMTAPTLQFLFEARKQGEQVDAKVVEQALVTLEAARLDTGAFQYGSNHEHQTGKGFEDIPGAIGRMPVCEATLFLAGRGSVERIQSALDQFFEHWKWLEARRQQKGTHEGPYKIAPYYFFYAHRYTAQAIELLPAEVREKYRNQLYALLWKVKENDGSFNDRVFPRSACFGTAMSMLALMQPTLPPPARWSEK